MAAIAEWGTQEYTISLDPRLRDGIFWGFTGTGGGGERDRYAAGAEFLVPATDTVTVTAAIRYDYYDDITDVDGAPTWALGIEYRPMDSLLLRGRYATSFRAPDMHFVFAEPSGFFQTVPDYYLCARDLGIDESSPGGLASCVDPIRGPLGTSSVQGSRSGNPGLEEEEGESYTIGFVWNILDNLSVSLDYYDIRLENIVVDRSVDTLLRDERACLLGGSYTVTPGTNCDDVLARIMRNPTDGGVNSETLNSVAIGPFNQAVQETNGIDATLNYAQDTQNAGLFTVDISWTRVFDQKAATLPTDPVVSFQDGGTQDFRSRFRTTVGWSYERFSTTVLWNRLGSSLTNDSLFSDTKNRVDALDIFNATARYQFTDAFSVTLIGNNILNEKPPITSEEPYPYFNAFNYDPYGREYFVEFGYVFD
jgi:outer membrane receptor protein involved in Fe transport